MNEIQRLIHEMCPDGVPMVAFDMCATFTRGVTYNKKQESDIRDTAAIKILRANNITLEANCLNFDDIKFVKGEVKIRQDQWLNTGDILICAGSGSKEHIGKVAYIEEDIPYSFGGFMAVIRPKANTISRYLFHILISRTFKDYLLSSLNSTTINNLNSTVINGFQIPLPPLPIQRRIVEILDKFTSLVSLLDSEIALRQKQYEYYRNKLLSFEGIESIIYTSATLSDISYYPKERIEAKLLNEANYVSVENLFQNKAGKGRSTKCPTTGNWIKYIPNDILIGNIRPYLKKIWYSDTVGGTNGDVLVIRIKQESFGTIIPQYLFKVLSSDDFFEYDTKHSSGAKMPRGDKDSVMKYTFSIPPLHVQHSIVQTLDTFESLLANLKQERELRQKQYEYYREKLLTFE